MHVDTSGITVPARTTADFAIDPVAISAAGPGGYRVTDADLDSYTCIDCGYMTNVLLLMVEHQRDQAKAHTRRQRLARWHKMRGGRVILAFGAGANLGSAAFNGVLFVLGGSLVSLALCAAGVLIVAFLAVCWKKWRPS